VQSEIEGAFIGVNHLAARLGISARTVWRVIQRGELPTVRIGRRTLIRQSAVRAWLAGCESPTPSPNVTNLHRQFR
jgi:excisionase family DNA binding protein